MFHTNDVILAFECQALVNAVVSRICNNMSLTIKGQNIGASTKIFCKPMSYFDILDKNKLKYMYFGSFKNHAVTSNAINC